MKNYTDTIKKALLFGLIAGISMLGVVYAANITSTTQTINTGDTISQSWYNDVNDKLNNGVGGLGVGQTRTDVLSNRNYDTNYRNNTGKPIVVKVSYLNGGNLGTVAVHGYVDGLLVEYTGVANNRRNSITLIVPDGSTYKVTTSGTSNAAWVELR